MSTPISDAIARYEVDRTIHGSGSLDIEVLREIERLISGHLNASAETGCGKSTILFSRLSKNHIVFAADDTALENSSVEYFRRCPDADESHLTLVLGPTQQTMKSFEFPTTLDLVFLDGPHGYPFPELEYYYTYPHLRKGGWLIIDDVHIPTIHRLYEFLLEEEMFEHVALVRTTAIFRRTSAPTFDPTGDGWWLQHFNAVRFPIQSQQQRTIAELQAALDHARGQEEWWKHVAEERRLRTRLKRRVEWLKGLLPISRS